MANGRMPVRLSSRSPETHPHRVLAPARCSLPEARSLLGRVERDGRVGEWLHWPPWLRLSFVALAALPHQRLQLPRLAWRAWLFSCSAIAPQQKSPSTAFPTDQRAAPPDERPALGPRRPRDLAMAPLPLVFSELLTVLNMRWTACFPRFPSQSAPLAVCMSEERTTWWSKLEFSMFGNLSFFPHDPAPAVQLPPGQKEDPCSIAILGRRVEPHREN
ncbi:hypothetical protein B0T19DRAFT_282072 [Cercophora scortea]|uniref:Uncharacterized protein n=1 Tax=Cercophora scortea TaxID=314031 RepID=A0AAE0I9C8_9PEZI|nr:hypothetical protein B0T19DRAFT_282072 [Cercophora scortea]